MNSRVNGLLVGFYILICVYILSASEDSPNALNKSCQRWEDCAAFGYYCDVNMTCQCTSNFVMDSTKTRCIGGVNQKCEYDVDCIEKAFCEKQTMCKCKKKYHPSVDGVVCVRNSSNKLRSIKSLSILVFTLILMRIS